MNKSIKFVILGREGFLVEVGKLGVCGGDFGGKVWFGF